MKTPLKLIQLSNEELDKLIDESPNNMKLIVKTTLFLKELKWKNEELKGVFKKLAYQADVTRTVNGDYLWRCNRNAFKTKEMQMHKNEEHEWCLDPRDEFTAYIVDDNDEEYLQKMVALSMGCTYDMDENEWNLPDYTNAPIYGL